MTSRPWDSRPRLVAAGAAAIAVLVAATVAVVLTTTSKPSTRVGVTASGGHPTTAPAPAGSAAPTPSITVADTSRTTAAAPKATVIGPTVTAATPRTSSAVSPTTTVAGTVAGTTAVTEHDNARSYVLTRGDRLVVNLTGPTVYTWTEPTSSDGAVLRRTAASPGTTASAVFVAAAAGQSTVSAIDNPNCGPKCLPPTQLFRISVSVTG